MQIISCLREKFVLNRPVWITGTAMCAALLATLLFRVDFSSAGMPVLAEKKSVILEIKRAEAEQIFDVSCTNCHAAPNPINQVSGKPTCWKGLSKEGHDRLQTYLADVVNGKRLYESHCGRCHELIPPSAHEREYWSKNICTSEECFIENLNKEAEQQVLLYLRSQAKKE